MERILFAPLLSSLADNGSGRGARGRSGERITTGAAGYDRAADRTPRRTLFPSEYLFSLDPPPRNRSG